MVQGSGAAGLTCVSENTPPPDRSQEKCVKPAGSVKCPVIDILGIMRKRSENSPHIKLVN